MKNRFALTRREFSRTALGAAFVLPLQGSLLKQIVSKTETERFELFRHPLAQPVKVDPSTGEVLQTTIAHNSSIWINREAGIVKKIYSVDAICCGGAKPQQNESARLSFQYFQEKEAYLKLASMGSRYIPQGIRFNDWEQSITMPYLGPDLLVRMEHDKDWRPSDAHLRQIVEMHHEYREAGLFKRNFLRSNLYLNESTGRLIAADFQESRPRKKRFFLRELQRNHVFLTPLSSELPKLLEPTYSDFAHLEIADFNDLLRSHYASPHPSQHDPREQKKTFRQVEALIWEKRRSKTIG